MYAIRTTMAYDGLLRATNRPHHPHNRALGGDPGRA